MANASFFEVVYALAMVARASLLIAKSSGSVGWSCPETAPPNPHHRGSTGSGYLVITKASKPIQIKPIKSV